METFTIVDGVVAVIIVVSAVLAYSRGLAREALSIGGWILAAIVGFTFAPVAAPLMLEVPYLSDLLRDSCDLSVIAGFAAVFALTLVVVSIFAPLFAGAIQRSALGGIDQGLGFLFGVARGVLLVGVALMVYDRLIVSDPVPAIDQSRSARIFASVEGEIDAQIPNDAPGWIAARYDELIATCNLESGDVVAPDSDSAIAPE